MAPVGSWPLVSITSHFFSSPKGCYKVFSTIKPQNGWSGTNKKANKNMWHSTITQKKGTPLFKILSYQSLYPGSLLPWPRKQESTVWKHWFEALSLDVVKTVVAVAYAHCGGMACLVCSPISADTSNTPPGQSDCPPFLIWKQNAAEPIPTQGMKGYLSLWTFCWIK